MHRETRRLTYEVDRRGGPIRRREMVFYVSARAMNMPRWGKTKLNKILWDADFSAYRERNLPVTGRPYQKLPAGPGPVEMPVILAQMEQDGTIEIEPITVGSHVEQRIDPKTTPPLHFFNDDDLTTTDKAIAHFWEMTAGESRDESHGVAWQTRPKLDPFPF